jgi:hypothetical protein
MLAHAMDAGFVRRRREAGLWAMKPLVGSRKMWLIMQWRRMRWRVISLVLVRDARVVREMASCSGTEAAMLKRVM